MRFVLRTVLRVSVGVVVALGIFAATTSTTVAASSRSRARLVGELGYEGGVSPGAFHPTTGTVVVSFTLNPLVLDWKVGPSGRFRIPLGPGTYTIVGCGPSSPTVSTPVCGSENTVTLTAHQVDHIRLVWAYVP